MLQSAWNLENFEKNWWFFGNFLKNWPKKVKFSKLFAKIPWKHWKFWRKSTSVFQGKIGQFSKLFAKIMRNLEKKKLTSEEKSTSVSCRNIYQGSLAFQRSKIWPFTKVYKDARGWHPVPVPRIYPRNQSIIEEIQEL